MPDTKLQAVRREHSMSFLRELHDEMLTAVDNLKASEAQVIRCLQKVDDHLVHRLLGYGSLHQYALRALHLSEAQACNFITVARKARDLPSLQAAIESGELTVSKARKITPVLNEENQERWIELCRTASAREVEKAVASVSPRAAVCERSRYVSASELELTMAISEKTFSMIKRAQDVLSQKGKRACGIEDAIVTALESLLEREDPLRKAQRAEARQSKLANAVAEVVVECDETDESESARAVQGRLAPLVRKRKKPASVFHRVRIRDQGRCQMRLPDGEVCGESRWVDVHHIVEHAKGGADTLENLVTLCHGHHQLQH